MELLFVNCCMKPDKESRTYRLATEFIDRLSEGNDVRVTEVALKNESIEAIDNKSLNYRLKLIEEEAWDNRVFRYARKFAAADVIVIAAPYWDLSFPSLLKVYFENVFVTNLTFCYEGPDAKSLCKAKKLAYITTSGGFIGDNDFGTEYVRGVADMFEIERFDAIKAEGLDIEGFDVEAILGDAIGKAREVADDWK